MNNYNVLIILISIILIFVMITCILYLTRTSAPSDSGALTCLPGQCIVNRFSGVKTCADNTNEALSYNPTVETCSDKYTCSDVINRYAELSDGSTNNNGLCETGVACNCFPDVRCSNVTLSYFKVMYGNPYQNFTTQPISGKETGTYKGKLTVKFRLEELMITGGRYQLAVGVALPKISWIIPPTNVLAFEVSPADYYNTNIEISNSKGYFVGNHNWDIN